MDLTPWLPCLPLLAALLQLPWFVLLSIAYLRAGGTSALPLFKLIHLQIPLPALAGPLLAGWLLLGGVHGVGWMFWTGAAVCALMCAGFAAVLLGRRTPAWCGHIVANIAGRRPRERPCLSCIQKT